MTPVETAKSQREGDRKSLIPSISLPKGGGAIRGMGEKFAANPVSGTGSMSVPIPMTAGRSGFGPQLSLAYDSASGNGPFGLGWSLTLPAITRKTEKGLPQYLDDQESDVYVLSGAEDLVPVLRPDGTRFEDRTTAPGYLIHRYRPRIEGLFARIERWTERATGAIHWRSISRDNVTTLYGRDSGCRIFDPSDADAEHSTRVFSWLISESYDDKGNAIVYQYAAEDERNVDRSQANERGRSRTANRYLKRIRYGNRVSRLIEPDLSQADWLFEVVFDYDEAHCEQVDLDPTRPEAQQHRFARASTAAGTSWAARPDPFSSYRAGFEVRTYRRCRRVLMFHHIPDLPSGEKGYDGLVQGIEFDYADLDYTQPVTLQQELGHGGSSRLASFLRGVTQSGYVRDDTQPVIVRDGAEYATYLQKSLPPLEFEYSKAAIQDRVQEVDAASLENQPAGLDGSRNQWVDLHGEGIPGILTEQAGAWFYKGNLSPLSERGVEFAPLQRVASKPNLSLAGGQAQFLDLAGDGQPDLVVLDGPVPGFYEHDTGEGWLPFRPFRSCLGRDTRDPNLRFIDLDGDGHADVLITEQDVFTWHPSLAEEGFGPARQVRGPLDEERGPRLVFADGTQSVYLADMGGDGLSDLVRIRNGEVCYWPNLGYGRFGAKVTLDNAPWFDHPDHFDQRRIRLADIDGSGTNDVIYLHREGARIYFNQSGNRLSEARCLEPLPHLDDDSTVITADLLGNGTACLVWSSPLPGDARRPMRYLDLMGGTKPHLLIKSINNLGAETEIHYAPSTYFYLKDKRDGRPWVTRLPFPVQVVERLVTLDRVSGNRFVTRYEYHHGYFDGVEREFRGFGRVDQWDTEEFAALAGGAAPAENLADASSHLPPVVTRSWFHTGVYDEVEEVSQHFAAEYYGAPKPSEPGYDAAFEEFFGTLLPDTVLPHALSPEEEREACRALKGSMLRQEVYAADGTEEAEHPYAVTEQNFTLRRLQPRGGNRHGVFLAHARESISYHYERKPVDPRIGHALTLEVDEFGNVLKSAAIGYGRRQPDPSLAPADQARQAETLITYSESRLTHAVDTAEDHRTPLPCESRTCELTGLALPAGRDRFSFEEVLEAGESALPLDYERAPTAGRLEKRRVEHARTYYRADSLDGPLALGEMGSLALPYERYRLAFTPGLVSQVYGGRVSEALLGEEGGYCHTEGDADWWIPAGRIFYSPDPAHTPAEELAYARQHFFLPHRYRDPFHTSAVSTESRVGYDAYSLLVEETRDPLGNRITAGERSADPDQPLQRRGQDYRVLQPALVMDPNRNRSAVAFDALGRVVATAVLAKPAPAAAEGDSLDGFAPDLTQDEIDRLLADPEGPLAAVLLAGATTRVVHELGAYRREPDPLKRPPAVTVAIVRETHASELPAGQPAGIQVSLAYSDGFGREIQKKIQAEPGPVPQRDAAGRILLAADGLPVMTPDEVSPRWAGSGWTVFNNKGEPVRRYEPFFTDTHRFEFDVRIGVSPVLFYDPVRRVVASLHPDHSWEKVVFDPWRQETWDAHDTLLIADPATDADAGPFFARLAGIDYLPTWHALRTDAAHAAAFAARYPDAVDRARETGAAEKSRSHAATPTVAHADSLGRTFLTLAHNRAQYSDTPAGAPPVEEFHAARIRLDIEGNQREVWDASGRLVMRYDHDMLGNLVHQASMEAGERWILNDVAGNPLYAWDSGGHRHRSAYDAGRRPIGSFVRTGPGAEALVWRAVYGESLPDPEAGNLRGRVCELYDQAGVVHHEEYDFKGNLLSSQRRLAQSYRAAPDWLATVPLEAESYASRSRYDALNRVSQSVAPHSDEPGTRLNVVQPVYNKANLLEQVNAWLDCSDLPSSLLDPATASLPAVRNIHYNARGQRLSIEQGNGVTTTYRYDPLTFRLVQLLTVRDGAGFPDDCPQPPPAGWPGCQLQNLHYTYDPAGNVTSVRDDAQQTIFFKNTRVEPSAEYTYDALHRLIEATGREHLGQVGRAPIPHSYNDVPRAGLQHPGDGQALGRYLERYRYDAAGNFLSLQHRGSDPAHPGWLRSYHYEEASQLEPGERSNRLTRSAVGDTLETYSAGGDGYDDHGNLLRLPQLEEMRWDFEDRLQMTRRQAVNPEDGDGAAHQGERSWYVYDSTGQRLRKVTEAASGQLEEERIYLGGLEIYRRRVGSPLVRETLHLMDTKQRIAVVETRTQGTGTGPAQLVRYQLANHLGSASLELDGRGRILSYEEYTPYGSTSYQAVSAQLETPKRYRYTGQERDEESGLYYHGARYYAPWLGIWMSPDPAFLSDGTNLYAYVNRNPIRLYDPSGRNGWEFFRDYLADPLVATIPMVGSVARTFPAQARREFVTGVVQGQVNTVVSLAREGVARAQRTLTELQDNPQYMAAGPTGVATAATVAEVRHLGGRIQTAAQQQGGGARGYYVAVNQVLNPAYGIFEHGDQMITALREGRYRDAGQAAHRTTLSAVETALLAEGVARAVTPRAPAPRTAPGRSSVAPEVAGGGRRSRASTGTRRPSTRVQPSEYSGPWVNEATNVRRGGSVAQCSGGSCVSAAGEMLTGGSVTEAQLLSRLGEWSDPVALRTELNRLAGSEAWRGGYFTDASEALSAARQGPMAAILQAPGGRGHAVLIEPIARGRFRVRDPLPGVTYEVSASWVRRFVSGGVFR